MIARVAILFLFFSGTSFAQKDEAPVYPIKMIDFLRVGSAVGLSTNEGTTNMTVRTYQNDDYRLALKLHGLGPRTIDAHELAEKDERVRKQLELYLKERAEKFPAVESSEDKDTERNESITISPLYRTSFGRVLAIGEDYILVQYETGSRSKRVIPTSAISSIFLDYPAIRFRDARGFYQSYTARPR